MVEQTASFADGGNGQGEYPHIVRDIISLGEELSGTATITIPDAHDGDDLEIHLIHEIVLPEPEPVICTEDLCWDGSSRDPADCGCPVETEPEIGLPALGFFAVISAISLAAIVQNKRDY